MTPGGGVRDKHLRERFELIPGPSLVLINTTCRSGMTCGNSTWHNANPKLDNCYRDYAQRDARELADLLRVDPLS